MYIGAGLLLLVAGAVLAFGVTATISGINLVTIGYIMMAVGALAIVLSLVLAAPRRRSVRTVVEAGPVASPVDGYPLAGQVVNPTVPLVDPAGRHRTVVERDDIV